MEFDYSDSNLKKIIKEFRSKKTGDGRRGPFYNGSQTWIFDVDNDKLFKNAVWQAYLDASRTFVNISNTRKCSEAFDNLSCSIQKYFKGEEEFSHSEWCEQFIDYVRKYNGCEARYGQAQKSREYGL